MRGHLVSTTDLPPVLANFCAVEHPFIPGALCRVVGPHDLHDYDGVDPWTPNPNTKDDDR